MNINSTGLQDIGFFNTALTKRSYRELASALWVSFWMTPPTQQLLRSCLLVFFNGANRETIAREVVIVEPKKYFFFPYKKDILYKRN